MSKKEIKVNILLTFACILLLSLIGFGAYVAMRPLFQTAKAESSGEKLVFEETPGSGAKPAAASGLLSA